MRMIMIIVVALVLLGGAGAGAYFYFHQSAEASVGKEAEAEPKKEAKVNTDAFVELDPLILPIIGSNGVTQTVSIVVVLEVEDDKTAEIVKHLTPRLKDAYIQDMYGVLSRRNAMRNGTLDVGMVKERLNKISQTALGEGIVKDVLLQVVQQHPI